MLAGGVPGPNRDVAPVRNGQAAKLYEAGRFSMPVEQAFPLDQAPEAQRISQAGHVRGKLVLIVD